MRHRNAVFCTILSECLNCSYLCSKSVSQGSIMVHTVLFSQKFCPALLVSLSWLLMSTNPSSRHFSQAYAVASAKVCQVLTCLLEAYRHARTHAHTHTCARTHAIDLPFAVLHWNSSDTGCYTVQSYYLLVVISGTLTPSC